MILASGEKHKAKWAFLIESSQEKKANRDDTKNFILNLFRLLIDFFEFLHKSEYITTQVMQDHFIGRLQE